MEDSFTHLSKTFYVCGQRARKPRNYWSRFSKTSTQLNLINRFGGGGQVVSMLALFSNNPSSNPTEVNKFSVNLLMKGPTETKGQVSAHLNMDRSSWQIRC